MSGGPAPRRPRSLGDDLPWVVLGLAAFVVVLAVLFHIAVVVVAAVAGNPVPGMGETATAVRGSPGNPVAGYVHPPGPSAAVWVVFVVLLGMVVAAGGAVSAAWGRRRADRRQGRATPGDLAALRRGPARLAAMAVRPACPPDRSKPAPSDTELVVRLGSLRGTDLFAQHEDSTLVLASPRSGKTVGVVVPRIIDAPGPVVATGTKNDVVFLTAGRRATRGSIHVFDVDGITGWPSRLCWDPVAGCHDPDEALARGQAWAAADPSIDEGTGNATWFSRRAGEVLAYLLHAAALKPGGSMRDVVRWAADFELAEPATILRSQGATRPATAESDAGPVAPDMGTRSWADLLTARTQAKAGETVDSLRMTLSGVLAPLTSPRVMRAVCPEAGDRVLDIHRFLGSRDTLYLMSATGSASVAPLITTLADTVVRRARALSQHAPGGRLWPPLAVVLEEAANTAPLPDLPGLMSDSGGRGISVMVVAQSVDQMVGRWGAAGAGAIRAAATTKLYLPGISEQEVLQQLSATAGRYRQQRTSVSTSRDGGSVSTSSEWEAVMTDQDVRQMRTGQALLVHRNLPAAVIDLRPWWNRADAAQIRQDLVAVETATGRKIES